MLQILAAVLHLIITCCYGLTAGPTQSNDWSFSSNIPFGLTVRGIDLSSSDTIRLLEAGSSCTQNSGDPVDVVTSMYYDCPDIAAGCAWMRTTPVVNIPTLTTSSACNQFSASLACTGSVSAISSITVSELGWVLMNFTDSPQLEVGDFVLVNSGVTCGSDCTSNMLDLLMNGLTAINNARVGNNITNITSTLSVNFSIPSFASSTPPVFILDQVSPPTWSRTSRQDTAVALVGTVPKTNLVVCWNKGGVASGYHVQIGTLSIIDPPLFENVALYPYGFAPETSRFILTFSSSNSPVYSATPTSYTEQSALVITWTQPTVLRPIQNVDPNIPVVNAGFSQETCGVYLDELWSSNSSVGFPTPQNCSLTISSVAGSEVQIELVILFSPTNGLPPSSDFSILFRGQSDPSSILSSSPCCETNTCMTPTSSPFSRACQYMKLAYIPAYLASPYNALQMGFAKFSSTVPVNFNRLPSHPQIASAVINTFAANNALPTGLVSNLMFTLTPGVVATDYYVRIYCVPALIWRLQPYCAGTIATGATAPVSMDSATPLSLCTGIELVPNSGIITGLLLRIPDLGGQPMTDFLYINLVNIPTPSGGTFGSHFLIQITDSGDLFPQLVSTSNQYVKQPDLLRSVARITPNTLLRISSFVNMTTVVVMQIVPALPLAVGDEIKIKSPVGFMCNGIAAPAIPTDLYEKFPIPSSYGQVVAGTYSTTPGDDRSCQISLTTSLPANSPLMVTMNITTSSTPILITNPANVWMVYISRPSLPKTYPTGVFAPLSDTDWQSNFAILSVMSNYHMEPMSSWVPPINANQALPRRMAMFLSPGTPIVDKGSIVIALPYMFTNASEYIAWGDLDDYMYKTGGPNDRVIHRLPPAISPGYIDVGRQFAVLPFNGSLVASWTYGFWIEVKPVFPVPTSLMWPYTSRSVWHIRTMYAQYGVLASGDNPRIIPLFEGVYEQPKYYLAQVPMDISFSSLVPFAVSAIPSTLTFSFAIPTSIATSVPVRISGPSGFSFVKTNCVTVLTGSWTPVCNHVSQIASTNILIVAPATYAAGPYSGQVSVEIPDRSPTRSLNKWRIEFGFSAILVPTVYGRLIAESSDNQNDARILGLLNGAVSPESIVVDDIHFLSLTIETISPIPSGGAIAVTIPSSIAMIVEPCEGYKLDGTTFPTLCSVNTLENTVIFPGPWTPGTRTFYLKVQNVASPTFVSTTQTAPCYATYCFLFSSLSDSSNLQSYIDYSLYVVSYSVMKQSPIGGFAPLTNSVVQQFVGVNNGPLNRNNFVITFSVLPVAAGEPPAADPPFILVRAPYGFEFDPSCTGTIGLLPSQVFSDTMPWPPQYTELTDQTYVTSCIGIKNIATIYLSIPLDPTIGSSAYAIRLGVASNPAFLLPVDSAWYVQIGSNQATSPFESFKLAIMDPTVSEIIPSATGYRVDLTAPIQSQLNPITIVLKPTTSVSNPGTLVITTPSDTGYRFDPGWSCLYLKFSDSVSTWDQASILCQVPSDQLSLSLTIPSGETFSANSVYTIETSVFNPTNASQDSIPSGSSSWIVGTFMNNIPRDQSALPGFILTDPIAKISVTSNQVFGGLALIPSLTITVQARTVIPSSTIITVQAPPGFNFITNSIGSTPSLGGCFGLLTSVISGSVTSAFSGSVDCNTDSVEITINNNLNLNDNLIISLECINPATTPSFPNFWYFSSSSIVFGGAAGWTILPQLSNVSISLDGPNYAINSYSHLTAKFSTVQACNMVQFTFPSGFDLSAGVFNVIQTINGFSVENLITETVLSNNQPNKVTLTLLTPIAGGGIPVIIQMENVKLGDESGSITVSIATFLDDVPVDQYTELLAFILAGQVTVVDKLLSSPYREAALMVEPANSTLIPLLTAQTGEIGIVHLSLFFSSPVLQNERFLVGSFWYDFAEMNRSQVSLIDTFSQTELGVSQIVLFNNSMMFTVNSFIPVGAITRLSFPVKIPLYSNEAVSNFLIRSFLPGAGDSLSYPLHSNDNVTEGFVVSSPLEFTLSTIRSPPSANVNVSLNIISAGYRRIFTMKLVTPSGYYFQNNTCLISNGNFSKPLSCVTKNFEFTNNRSSAVFNFDLAGDGLLPTMLPIVGIQISIVTPSVQPTVGNWYLFGRGLDDVEVSWGVSTNPFVVNPINFFDVQYSNLVGIRTPLAVSFAVLERVPAGGMIRLYYPDALTIDCTTFMRTTLPFYDEATKKICEVTTNPLDLMSNSTIKISSRSFTIFMTYDLIPGNFTFTIDVLTPTKSIVSPIFSLAIIGPNGNIYASILNETGPALGGSNALSLTVSSNTNARLLWYPSVAVAESVMTVGISIISQKIFLAGQVNLFMIYFPFGFLNAISIPSDLTVTSSSPITVTFIDFSNQNYIGIYIDQSEQTQTGQFTFSFPVYVPPQVPSKNLWYMCACDQGSCTNPFDRGVMTYFPISGFSIGQANPLTAT